MDVKRYVRRIGEIDWGDFYSSRDINKINSIF